jgi:predicted metal-dependent peptidase
MKPNQYFDESGFMLPSLDSERFGTAVFATDTSGSINQEVLKHFQSVKQACLDEMKPGKLVDIYCDSQIQAVNEYVPGEEISRKAPGGGGTRFEPVFEKVNDLPEPPKLLVYLTDLQGSFPTEEPPYPTLWIVYNNKGAKAPFGEVVEVDE